MATRYRLAPPLPVELEMNLPEITPTGVIRTIDDGPEMLIPPVLSNRDWDEYQIWLSEGNEPEPVLVPPTPVPQSISDRQFFQQLSIFGIISEDEALASNRGIIPAPMLAIIDQMPADQQFSAKMIISGATVYNRNDPLTIGIGTAYGWTSEQIDDFFRAASAL